MALRSRRGVIVGAVIALALPISYAVFALLLTNGIVQFTREGLLNELISSLSLNAAAGFVLALLGIVIAGRAARLQSLWAWLGLMIIGLPVLAFVWFITYATLGGAMGSPF
jgi:hypothetical protein